MWRMLPFLLCLQGCALLAFSRPLLDHCPTDYRDERYPNERYTPWAFRGEATTPGGVVVDFSGRPPDRMVLERIDGLIERTGDCMGRRIHGCALRVKIVPAAAITECAGVQVFSCTAIRQNADHADCGGCTGVVEWPATIVTTPDLASLPHELLHAAFQLDHGAPEFPRCGP